MKIAKNRTESVFNTTSSVPKPYDIEHGLYRGGKRRGPLDVHKWLIENLPPMKPLDKRPISRTPSPWPPLDYLHPIRPSKKWPPIEKFPNMRPEFENLPAIRSFDDWSGSRVDRVHHFEVDYKLPHFKFEFTHPTPPPFVAAADTGSIVLKVFGGAVGGIVALIILASVMSGKGKRSSRGAVVGADAVQQDIPTATGSIGLAEPGSLYDDLPPPYSECTPSSINKYVNEEPPPYTYPQDAEPHQYKQQQNAFIENERRADCGAMITSSNHSEDVAPGMRTELVFDNGRVVERLSVDLNSNNNETGGAGDGNVQE